MEAERSSETLASAFKSTWCYNPPDQRRQVRNRENLKPHSGQLTLADTNQKYSDTEQS
jgi:hypothetical protein